MVEALAYSLHCYFATSVHHFFFCSPTRASTILCSLATLLLRYIGTSFLLLFPHKSFHHTILSRYITTSLHRYIATSLHRYIATLLHRYIATLLHRILWHTLAYSGILLHTLAYSGIPWHTLAYFGILLHTLAYSVTLLHTLTYSCIL